MKELIKKSMLLGLGAASLSKDKVDKLVKRFVRNKTITAKDAKWVKKQVLNELAKNRKRLEKLSRLKTEKLKKKAKILEKALTRRGKITANEILRRIEKELS
ncbi:hypothetical protein CMO83_01135 [Candidatus Woesearchaeota archaeon]|jgi:polyhydroxyalkanoate synthesis regulator phasin|nr:hypothetical protein [Candidatus Woesearchaeota archaeon]MDP6648470.1 hypothetical protein [Candidatus Woesearchaeota archaeon]|tara:strand:- start:26832 stop:27137 length:306 start_codon:yes stop_codon:yes gene_type:complete